ncbi:WD40 repeat domain-containing protein [Micromonospora profundi]|uniref:WD40 repeat domain-containing protein n=1 Tax=Micromonospora profundi TaxID=1420889 RepID=UPI003657EB88
MWMVGAPPVDTGHTAAVTALAAGTRGSRPVFASSSADGTIRLWGRGHRRDRRFDQGQRFHR